MKEIPAVTDVYTPEKYIKAHMDILTATLQMVSIGYVWCVSVNTQKTMKETMIIMTGYLMSLDEFINACLEYNKENNIDAEDIKRLEMCPIHAYASNIHKSCKTTVAGIKTCPLCFKPMCPICGNHNVTQLSRVTGYVGDVSGWNEAKKQELKDRQRYNL